MEYGTKPHKISAKTANALKFEVGGNTVFAKSVMHPGTKPMPFMFPAFLTARKDFIDDLQQIMDEVVEG
ncbi:hypothetical protein CVR96_27540 [Salmonella enterica subsp. enterica serovar Typhimurium]|uniref:hypothetical protein n=1 Tax=Salmonella enterica TaxID=28901 RepID=UPI000C22DD75|nr:hypothetical protein [Salmonella enterica]PJH69208.1 hypothetical protein CVR96_27540 [Salmonella enterica subsp. enterica serovar Typhimurium]